MATRLKPLSNKGMLEHTLRTGQLQQPAQPLNQYCGLDVSNRSPKHRPYHDPSPSSTVDEHAEPSTLFILSPLSAALAEVWLTTRHVPRRNHIGIPGLHRACEHLVQVSWHRIVGHCRDAVGFLRAVQHYLPVSWHAHVGKPRWSMTLVSRRVGQPATRTLPALFCILPLAPTKQNPNSPKTFTVR